MKKASPFQIIILVVFGVIILFAVMVFSSGGSNSRGEVFLGNVTIWGTLPKNVIQNSIDDIHTRDKTIKISYVEKQKNTFDGELIEALASGVGPDAILLSHDLILSHANKIFKIPPESMSERAFKDRFIEEGELYLTGGGIFALPLVVNPMIMYWNRDVFSASGKSSPPTTWEEFYAIARDFTLVDGATSDISRSAIAFGEFRNVTHAKEILSMLVLQAGNPIVIKQAGVYKSALDKGLDFNVTPANEALRFFTEFSNPAKIVYSWNRALPDSKNMFIEGSLATYFGFASEFADLKRKNPHLNFDIAKMPQAKKVEGSDSRNITYGNMQGLAILKASKNIPATFKSIVLLSDEISADIISEGLDLPPTRRDLLAKKPTGEYMPLFYESALISRAWLDPTPKGTTRMFMNMIERVVSGRSSVGESVSNADSVLSQFLLDVKTNISL